MNPNVLNPIVAKTKDCNESVAILKKIDERNKEKNRALEIKFFWLLNLANATTINIPKRAPEKLGLPRVKTIPVNEEFQGTGSIFKYWMYP
jgi:hypothetical protein